MEKITLGEITFDTRFSLNPVSNRKLHQLFFKTFRYRERKRVQQETEIINQVNDCVIITDLRNNITFWNNGAFRLYGYTSEEIIGKHVSLLYFEEDYETFEDEIIVPLMKKDNHEIDIRVKSKSGEVLIIHQFLSLLRSSAGSLNGALSSQFRYDIL